MIRKGMRFFLLVSSVFGKTVMEFTVLIDPGHGGKYVGGVSASGRVIEWL